MVMHALPYMASADPKPLTPRQATDLLRSKADEHLSLLWTNHAKERLQERELTMSDVIHVMKHGFVHEEAEPTTRAGFFKYRMVAATPNSGGRQVRIVVIPTPANQVKLVTVMWADER